MRGNRGSAMVQFLEDLSEGDPVALALVGTVAVIAIGLGLFVLKVRRDLQREDAAIAKKHGRKL